MSFQIVRDDGLSLNDLLALRGHGVSVVKTPHVGNWARGNLLVAIASSGKSRISMSVYDRTIVGVDNDFWPGHVIAGGNAEMVCERDMLSTHAKVVNRPAIFDQYFAPGRSVLEGHMETLRQALPGVRIQTYTDYLRSHESLVLGLLEAVTRANPNLWYRQVNEAGIVRKECGCKGWDSIERTGIFGLAGRSSGWLIPNILNVLLDAIIEAKTTGLSAVYHLSGKDMVKYAGSMETELGRLYEICHREVTGLPECLSFHLINASGMRFACPENEQALMNNLVEAYREFQQAVRVMRSVLGPTVAGKERSHLITKFSEPKNKAGKRLTQALRECPGIFYEPEPKFFSHLDVLSGSGLYVHPWVLDASAGELVSAMELFGKFSSG